MKERPSHLSKQSKVEANLQLPVLTDEQLDQIYSDIVEIYTRSALSKNEGAAEISHEHHISPVFEYIQTILKALRQKTPFSEPSDEQIADTIVETFKKRGGINRSVALMAVEACLNGGLQAQSQKPQFEIDYKKRRITQTEYETAMLRVLESGEAFTVFNVAKVLAIYIFGVPLEHLPEKGRRIRKATDSYTRQLAQKSVFRDERERELSSLCEKIKRQERSS